VKQLITSPDAPGAGGAYSPALRVGQLLFISGQVSIDPRSGQFVAGDIKVSLAEVELKVRDLLGMKQGGVEEEVVAERVERDGVTDQSSAAAESQ
jgi:2-iminobutanoate/2-iminopropanoate deaminase